MPIPAPLLSPLESPPPPQKKKPWQSKTIWANAAAALLMLHPKTASFVAQYPDSVAAGILILNMLLRFISHGKISLGE